MMWHDDWIVQNYLDYPSYKELAQEHDRLFGTQMAVVTMKRHCKETLGLDKPRVRCRHFTEEQIEWLKEHYPKMGINDTLAAFNAEFHENRTRSGMKNFGKKYGVKVNESKATENKLKYGARRVGSLRAERKIGDIRFDCGRVYIKTESGWKQASRAEWEKHHGKIPKDHAIVYLDTDVTNNSIDNLLCVPIKYLGYMSKYEMWSKSPIITMTALKWCELFDKLKEEGVKFDNGEFNFKNAM